MPTVERGTFDFQVWTFPYRLELWKTRGSGQTQVSLFGVWPHNWRCFPSALQPLPTTCSKRELLWEMWRFSTSHDMRLAENPFLSYPENPIFPLVLCWLCPFNRLSADCWMWIFSLLRVYFRVCQLLPWNSVSLYQLVAIKTKKIRKLLFVLDPWSWTLNSSYYCL